MFLLAVPVMLVSALNAVPKPLSMLEQSAVRAAVYAGGPADEFSRREMRAVIGVPQVIAAAHAKNPVATLDLLTRIVDGADPFGSMTAASYAVELSGSPGDGLPCLWSFMAGGYDAVDPMWRQTKREHWVDVVRAAVKARAGVRPH